MEATSRVTDDSHFHRFCSHRCALRAGDVDCRGQDEVLREASSPAPRLSARTPISTRMRAIWAGSVRRSCACTTRSAPSAACRRCARTTRSCARPPSATRATWSASGYFDHTTPDGVDDGRPHPPRRLRRAHQGWALGENLAWGTGTCATPRGVIERLDELRRPPRQHPQARVPRGRHRHRRSACRATDGVGATYTADFGRRAAASPSLGRRWPTSNPSTPSTTTSTASAACSPSSRRPTT